MTATIHARRTLTASDRLGLTLFGAILFHAVLILGVSFDFKSKFAEKMPEAPSLDVTIVNTLSDTKPKSADYLAQANQEGGGNTKERDRPQSPPDAAPSPLPSPGNSEKTVVPKEAAEQVQTISKNPMTMENAPVAVKTGEEKPKEADVVPVAAELIRRSMDMAKLEAELSDSLKVYSKQPKEKLLIPSTMSHVEAAYLDAWQRKVELVGNMNYPEKAKSSKLSGDLLLMVAINVDGSLKEVQLIRSSGHKILDDAARRIVKLAEPYPPLPDDIRQQADVLKIPRVWRFTSGNTLQTRAQ